MIHIGCAQYICFGHAGTDVGRVAGRDLGVEGARMSSNKLSKSGLCQRNLPYDLITLVIVKQTFFENKLC